MKEMTSVATTMMSDEEKAEVEREMNEGRGPASPSTSSPPHGVMPTSPQAEAAPSTGVSTPVSKPEDAATATAPGSSLVSPLPSPGENGEQKDIGAHSHKGEKKKKLTPEQKKKLQELEEERRKNMDERIKMLTDKLVERLRPFIHAKRPGDKDDAETQQFEAKMKREADDMKLESFGVEVSLLRSHAYC